MTLTVTDSEEWRSVPSAPEYMVSNFGRILGPRGRILRAHVIKGGYHRVRLSGRNRLVHVVVAEAFIGPKPLGSEVNHRNGDKADNALSNLEYVSPKQNVRHSLDVLGVRRARGTRNGQARLTEREVREIRALYARGHSKSALARRMGVWPSTVARVISGERWSHVKDSDVDGD